MDGLLAGLEATALAEHLRASRWSYAAVNTTHLLGISLLIGAILPLELRLLGLWRSIATEALARVLVPVAATGLALAIGAGMLLFSVRAREYAALGVFQVKLALVTLGVAVAIAVQLARGWQLDRCGRGTAIALFSLACWLGALVCGRSIAFVAE
ncbi:MAG: hypothetical protein AB1749_08425 [Pseudomonadota bacterium]